ncbi:ABC transporter ATP-binding protein [Phaeovibrio sulfidiphilus]|uniref:ABC transporter ATP-binding protein n=1 Tax=Phaeovibrio sulfidiphilus TaxID=1220600 RepID=A0A8J6YNV6_9PROT|nr:ABC transporter ATP-binding protein [Phaeovibrio sulfidiphilus]MBE1237224.1 ABC transporter ATP-binding protein [Phaeovibrio sulfidiphilus]
MAESPTCAGAGGAAADASSVARPDYLAALRLLKSQSAGYRWPLFQAVVFSVAFVALDLLLVWGIWRLCAAVFQGTITAAVFLENGLLVLASVLLGQLAFGISTTKSHLVAFGLIRTVRQTLADHLSRLPLGWYSTRASGEAKKLVVDDPEQLEILTAHALPEGLGALFMWLGVSVWLFLVDWRMALATIVLTPVSFLILSRALAGSSALASDYQGALGRMNGAIVEYLAGMPVLKVFNRTGDSFAGTAEAVRAYTAIETRMGRQYILRGGTFQALVLANITVILPAGVWMLHAGWIDPQTLVFFAIVGGNYSVPLLKLFNVFHRFAHISMVSTLIEEVLGTPAQPDATRRVDLPDTDIVFEGVCFAYDGPDVVHDVSFRARSRSVTALVGPSGSGKSTVAALAARFHDVRQGRITLGGVDVRDIPQKQLMETVAFVFQDTFLFAATVAENLRVGKPDATREELEAAARAARAHEFIMALPQGYDTPVGERGRALSGGERQRLAIARAILKDAPVVILDEATAFTDPDNEAAIQEALSALSANKTLLVVAHRLHTIAAAECIVVLDRGRIAGSGTHEALLGQDGLYRTLWDNYTRARSLSLRTQTVPSAVPGEGA